MNRILIILGFCMLTCSLGFGQGPIPASNSKTEPIKIQTQGKKITVKSRTKINKLMIWTASGHRVIEDRNLHTNAWSYTLNINENIFYLMIELADGNRVTKKIGLYN